MTIAIIGLKTMPKAVIADVVTLQSLSPREFASGMAEVIKQNLIGDPDLFAKIENGSWIPTAGEFQPTAA